MRCAISSICPECGCCSSRSMATPTIPICRSNYAGNAVVYTGTHDNPTTRGWFEDLPEEQRQNLWKYLKRAPGTSGDAAPALMQLAWSSKAALAIAPLQDLLNLGNEARMNVPGRADRQLALALHRSHARTAPLSNGWAA